MYGVQRRWGGLAGKKSPTVDWLGRLAEALAVDPSELLLPEPGPTPEPKRGR